jgi:hypothetical protein
MAVLNRVVTGPAGGDCVVLTDEEERMFRDLVRRYQTDNKFQNISDLQDLERIIHLEVMSFRYMNWLTEDQDYAGEMIDARALARTITEFSGELRQLKKAIGIDKVSRQKDSQVDVASYIDNLKTRALQFGVHRENQLTMALTLTNDLIAMITLHDNCTPQERVDLKVGTEDIIRWIRETYIPEYQEIDKHFINTSQKYWVRDM